MPGNTDEAAQRRRRSDAIRSALVSSVWLIFCGTLLLVLRWYCRMEGFWGIVMLLLAVLDLGSVIPVWILLKSRLKEIEGGEEDAASQY